MWVWVVGLWRCLLYGRCYLHPRFVHRNKNKETAISISISNGPTLILVVDRSLSTGRGRSSQIEKEQTETPASCSQLLTMELEVATTATSMYKLQNPTELKNFKSQTPNVNLKLLFVSFLLLLVVFDEFVELHLVSGGVLA
jgi:hypothetical protein